jgi:hypothetical protein
MRLHSTICAICLLLSAVCLVGAYMLGGYWLILLAIPAMLLLWIAARGQAAFWLATSLLAIYVLLAVIGIIIGVQILPIVVGCILALAAWDLADFNEIMVRDVLPRARATLEKNRLQSLAITVGISLVLIGAGYWLRLRLPFGVIVILGLLVTGCIMYAVHRLSDSAAELKGP